MAGKTKMTHFQYPADFLQKKFLPAIVRIVLVAIALFFFCACDELQTDHACAPLDNKENTLRYDVNAPFETLDPTVVSYSGSVHVFPLLYSYLFIPDKDGNLQPDLAIRWNFDSQSLAWTIVLREDAMFHNGQKVTAQDVKYSMDSVFKNGQPQFRSIINGISCLSGTQLRIDLKKNDPDFLQSIWSAAIRPSPNKETVDFYHRPIGSGPFFFKSRKDKELIILEANPNYYDGRPSLDRIIFFYQPDREKTWTRLLRGETDIASEIVPVNYEMTKQYGKRFYFDQCILEYCTVLLYNTFDPLFSDPKVRMALSHAIDRHYIVREILKGYGVVASGPLGVQSPYRNPGMKPVPFNPEKAVALLKSSGWSHDKYGRLVSPDGSPFAFTLLVFKENQIEKTVAQYIQLCLDEIGIRMHVQQVPFDELRQAYYRNTEFQAVLTEVQTDELNPRVLLKVWSPSSSGSADAGCFHDSEATRMLTEAFQVNSPERQLLLLQKFSSRIVSLQPATFLFQKTAIDVMSRRFRLSSPFSLTYRGIYSLRYSSVGGK